MANIDIFQIGHRKIVINRQINNFKNLFKQMSRNTYSSEYSVPSLSLASSRSKRSIPTKDVNIQIPRPPQTKSRAQIMDRINRPPIFSSKNIRDSKVSVDSNSKYSSAGDIYKSIQTQNLSKNVYLLRQQSEPQSQPTFRGQVQNQSKQRQVQYQQKSKTTIMSSRPLLRNPESKQVIANQIQKRLESKKIDTSKSLFQKRISKLLEEAENFDRQLMDMYADDGGSIARELGVLEQYRKQALSFSIGSNLMQI